MLLSLLAFLLAPLVVSPAQAAMPATGFYLNSEGSPLIPLLQSVQKSLDIEIYTMQDPEVRSLVRAALERGVKIRVIQEPNPDGSKCDLFGESSDYSTTSSDADCADEKELVSQVKSAGGEYVPFNKANLCPNGGGTDGQGCYEHGKIAIADGTTLLLSSGNFDNTNLCIASEKPTQCDRDFTMISDDPEIVNTVSAIFEADLAGSSYDPRTLIPADLDQTITVSPYTLQPLTDFINSAQSTLEIETQYLHDPELNQAIEAAAKRGVQVSITVASVCAFGKPSTSEASDTTKTFTAFDKDGISTAMFDSSNLINGAAGYLHGKAIVADGNKAWVGSANGSNESLNENREYGLFFDTPADVQKLLSIVQSDHASQDSETWEQSLKCEKDKKPVNGGDTVTSSGSVSGSKPKPVSNSHPPKKPRPGHTHSTHSHHSAHHSPTHHKKQVVGIIGVVPSP